MRNEGPDSPGDIVEHERGLIATARDQAAQARARAVAAWNPAGVGLPPANSSEGHNGDPMQPLRDLLPGYELEREIHRGGQGVVYQALQKATRRQVAIKVMKEGPFAGSDDKARFDREVRILGQLNHPSIVAIHDSGTAAGCFYFAMNYVAGRPLDAYMRDSAPTLDEALRLFGKICDAVNAAHLRGIIHRDLKPSNIRIDAVGHPHVLDFGLATVEEGSTAPGETVVPSMTQTGQFIGSLPWASPEQAAGVAGGIDVRSDVYSLGVVLYQMLTATFPYDVHGSMPDVVQQILHAEPLRPSGIVRSKTSRYRINDELDTIVLKCLNKQRERRYQNAGELGRDIGHYLAGEPIEARRDSLGYMLRKTLWHHRLAVAFGGTLLLVLIGGLVVSLTFWRQALAAQSGLTLALTKANQREEDIRQIADAQASMLAGVDSETLGARLREDVFAEARAAMQRSEASAEESAARMQQLEQLLAGANFTNAGARSIDRNILTPALTAIERDFAGQPLIQATLWQSTARAYLRLGLYDLAAPLAERALEVRRRELGEDHPDTLESIQRLGDLLLRQGKDTEAEAYTREALEKRRRVLGEDHPDTLASLDDMGMFLLGHQKFAEAEAYSGEVLEKRRRILGDDDPATMESISRMAALFLHQNKLAEAEPLLREALERRRRVLGDDDRATLESISSMGGLLARQGKLSEAESYYQEALAGRRRTCGDEHPHTLMSIVTMGQLRVKQNRLDEAEIYYQQALDISRRVLGNDHRETTTRLNNMGSLRGAQGRLPEAESYFREVLERCRRDPGEDEPPTLLALSNLSNLLMLEGKDSEAEPFFRELLEKRRRLFGDDHEDTLQSINAMGGLYLRLGKLSEAEPYFQQALDACRRVLGDDHRSTVGAISAMGSLRRRQGRLDEAEILLREAVERARRLTTIKPPNMINILRGMGGVLQDKGRLAEAEPFFREAWEMGHRVLGDDSQATLPAMRDLGLLLAMRGEYAEAEPLCRDALDRLRRVGGNDHLDTLTAIDNVGVLLLAQGRSADAEGYFAEAVSRARGMLSSDHWLIGVFLTHHALALKATASFEPAEAELREAHTILCGSLGAAHVRTIDVVAAFVELYDTWHAAAPDDELDQRAAEWRARFEEWRALTPPATGP